MATFDYFRPAATALRMLNRYGAPVTVRKPATGAYDPATGMVDSDPVDYPGTGAKFDYEQRDVDGTLVQEADQLVYLAVQQQDGAAMPKPATGDQLLIGLESWTVVVAESLAPAGAPVLYTLQVRQ